MLSPSTAPNRNVSVDILVAFISPLQGWFVVEDDEFILDIPGSFAPRDKYSLLLKLSSTAFCIFALVYSIVKSDSAEAFFGNLKGVALCCSATYTCASLGNSLIGVIQPRRLESVSGAVRAQWLIFNVAAHAAVLSTILWLASCYKPGETKVTLENVSTHGGTLLVLGLEGFLVNRIPIRWYFWWGTCLPVVLGYIGWTYVQSLIDIGDLNEEESDSLYKFFDWENDLVWATIASLVSIFGVSPLIQTVLWLISQYGFSCGWGNIRRYANEEEIAQKSDSLTVRRNANEEKIVKSVSSAESTSEEP